MNVRILRLLCLVGLLATAGCNNDPWKNAPRPDPDIADNRIQVGLFQGQVNNNWITLGEPYSFLGPNTANHYDAERKRLHINRAGLTFSEHPTLGVVPDAHWHLLMLNCDLSKLPIPYTWGQTKLPDDYGKVPLILIGHYGRGGLPWLEMNETGNPGLLTTFRIESFADNILHITFSGYFRSQIHNVDFMVNQGELRVKIEVPQG